MTLDPQDLIRIMPAEGRYVSFLDIPPSAEGVFYVSCGDFRERRSAEPDGGTRAASSR